MILLIDNYDSFVYNLARYFTRLGQPTRVVRNDAIEVEQIRANPPEAIVISPGPCTPSEAGQSEAIVRAFYREIPMLGVCLGHQAIATALGGSLMRATEPVHGRISEVTHYRQGIFAELPNPMTVCRYHSLIVDEGQLPPDLEVTARTDDGIPMAISHREFPVFGVQFHPEAILTDHGFPLLVNFLRCAGVRAASQLTTNDIPTIDHERQAPAPLPLAPTITPPTF